VINATPRLFVPGKDLVPIVQEARWASGPVRTGAEINNNNNNLLAAIGLSPGGSVYFTCIQNMKLVTNKFKTGGLHEKHVVATWNLGNHLSICF